MKISFVVTATESGHAAHVWRHEATGVIEPMTADELNATDAARPGDTAFKRVANPEKRYTLTLRADQPGVRGEIEITSDDPKIVKTATTVTVEV